jgi:hypothetical protein
MTIRRECCNYCMWFGPVNQDDTMRKHRPATSEDKYGRKVQNMTEEPCPGSNKPFATFGCDTVPYPNPLFQEADTVTECPTHHIADKRGGRAAELGSIPACESGITYGAWSEGAGGFVYSGDCATEVANWAADELRTLAKDDDTDKFEILAICREHDEQPANGCEECATDA